MTEATKVLIYCRVSDTKQKTEGHGLDSQEHRCRQYAATHGYEVEQVFPDDASGGGDFMKRAGMVALLRYLDQNLHTNYVVLFDDLKRFARDREFHFKLRRELAARSANVECLNFTFDDTPEGEFVETIFAAQGQLERLQNRRQVIQKMKARMELGYYVFNAPIGYAYDKVAGHGKLLVRDEPIASILQQGLEGFASGHFQTQVEVQRFFESKPEFPKNKQGRVHPSRVKEILTHSLYSGHLEKEEWNLSMRKGYHEGLITLETFQKIQHRLTKQAKAPARKDISADFPLRGFIECDHCDRPMTGYWAQGKYKKFAYYSCYDKSCEGRKKAIPRAKLEGEFEEMLATLRPSEDLFNVAKAMFKDAWDQQYAQTASLLKATKHKVLGIEKQMEQLLDRIMESSNSTVIGKYEQRISELEHEKLIWAEKMTSQPQKHGTFEEMFELSMNFLLNPQKLWQSSRIEHKRAVLKLAFEDRIPYHRDKGLRTPKTTIPFSMLAGICGNNVEMVGDERLELPTSSV